MLVAVAVAVVAMVATSHAMRNDHHANLTTHASHLAATEANSKPACIVAQACDPASAELCLFVCAGLLSFVFPDQGTLVLERRTIGLKFPGVTVVRGHDPGRNDRPPISYLL